MSQASEQPLQPAGATDARRGSLTLAGGAGFLVLLALSGVVAFVAQLNFSTERVEQPVAFNHRLHVEEQELECWNCHAGYETGIHSGLPSAEICTLCHAEAQGDSAEEQRLVQMLEEGAPLEWQPLFRQPPHVFFSHRLHVKVAGLECASCHGDIGLSTAPPTTPRPLSMEQCIRCHEQQGASTSCAVCHR